MLRGGKPSGLDCESKGIVWGNNIVRKGADTSFSVVIDRFLQQLRYNQHKEEEQYANCRAGYRAEQNRQG